MLRALDETRIQGVTTTAQLHMSILNTERFRSGNVNTAMVRDMLEERCKRPLAEVAE